MDKSTLKFPNPPRPGDTVGLVSLASPVPCEYLTATEAALTKLGFHVKLGYYTKQSKNLHGYLAGNADERAEDLNLLFEDRTVKAIFNMRGGYGSAQILNRLDYGLISSNPKPFIGYSDLTNLHTVLIQECGICTFHGPMAYVNLRDNPQAYTVQSLFKALHLKASYMFQNPPWAQAIAPVVAGRAKGIIVGGNLTVLTRGIGTWYQLRTEGKILFLEDVGENIPHLDMMLTHLEDAGMMKGVKGLVLGQFEGCDNKRYDSSYRLEDFFADRFREYHVPILKNIASGHGKPVGTIPLGVQCSIDAYSNTLEFAL